MRIFRVRKLLLVLGLLPSLSLPPPLAVSDELTDAARFLQAGQLQEAEITLKSLLQEGDDAQARILLGRVYLEFLRGDAAEQAFSRAQALGVDSDDLPVLQARARLVQGDYARALDAATAVVSDAATQAELLAIQGLAQAKLDNQLEAEIALSKALELDPGNVTALSELAKSAFQRQERTRAEELLEQAATAHPGDLDIVKLRADLAIAEARYADAEVLLSQVVDQVPDRWMMLYKRALVRLQLGRLDDADADITAGVKSFPEFLGFEYARASLALARQDFAAALAHAEVFLRVNPTEPGANLVAAQAALKLSQLEQAREYIATHLRVMPDSRGGVLTNVMLLSELGELAEAEQALLPLVQADSDDQTALLTLAQIQQARGNLDEAERNFSRYLQRQPDDTDARLRLALVKASRGERAAADAQLERLLTVEPNYIPARLEQIRLAIQADDKERARLLAETLVEQYPDNPLALNALASAVALMGDQKRAKQLLDQALAIDSAAADLALNRAKLALAEGDVNTARRLYQAMIDANPDDTAALVGLGQLDVNAGDKASALRNLERALDASPANVDIRLNLVNGYLSAGRVEDASRLLNAPSASTSGSPRLLEAQGRIALMQDQPFAAVTAFEQLTERLPESAPAQYLLAFAYAKTKNTTGASNALIRGFELASDDPLADQAFVELITASQDQGAIDGLLQRLERVRPGSTQLQYFSALLLQARGDREQAAAALSELHKRVPDDRRYFDALLRHQERSGDNAGALKTAQRWLTRHPDDLVTRRQVAQLYAALGKQAQAAAAYEEVLERNANDVVALNNLAALLLDGEPDEAVRKARQALALAPDNPAVADTLGQGLLATNQMDEAVRVLRKAHEGLRGDPRVTLHYAQALAATGETSQARELLQLLLQRSQNDSDIAEAERLLQQLK